MEDNNLEKKENNNIYGGFSLGLGIASVVLFLMPYLTFVLSILAIVFSRIQQNKKHSGLATAGLITGIIGLVLSFIFGLIFLIYFVAMM